MSGFASSQGVEGLGKSTQKICLCTMALDVPGLLLPIRNQETHVSACGMALVERRVGRSSHPHAKTLAESACGTSSLLLCEETYQRCLDHLLKGPCELREGSRDTGSVVLRATR